MMDILLNTGDDQVALIGCAGVLLGSGFLMYISYFLGPKSQEVQSRQLDRLIRSRQQLTETVVTLDPACDKAA